MRSLSTTAAVLQRPRSKPTVRPAARGAVDDTTLRNLADVFQMLADPSRLKILLALATDGEMHVTALRDHLGQSQPAVSHHLALLRSRRLVSCRRDGKNNFYSVDSAFLSDLLDEFFAAAGYGQRQIQLDGMALAIKYR